MTEKKMIALFKGHVRFQRRDSAGLLGNEIIERALFRLEDLVRKIPSPARSDDHCHHIAMAGATAVRNYLVAMGKEGLITEWEINDLVLDYLAGAKFLARRTPSRPFTELQRATRLARIERLV